MDEAVVFEDEVVGICKDSPRPKKSGRLGVCGELPIKLSSFVEVSSGEGWSLAAFAVASEMDRLLDGVAIRASILVVFVVVVLCPRVL